jgi:hypothetical protein
MTDRHVYDPLRFERVHVRDDEALKRIAPRFESSDAVGVDIEMGQHVERRPGGLQEWSHVLALIQIASESLSALVDPLRCNDLSPLRPLLAGNVRKVFLGGGQDSALLEGAGIPARNIVDVGEIALAVFGRREDGMAALARRIFDISLDKSVRRTDWMRRPLNPALIAYAYRDAEFTLLIYRWFQEHYPDAVALHERQHLEARLSEDIAPWIAAALAGTRSAPDPLAVVMEHGFDPKRDREVLTEDMHLALAETTAPRLVNKLVRVSSDVGLIALVPDFILLTHSQSSLIRTAAARAIGVLATPESGEEPLIRLKEDPIAEVKSAAEAGLKDLQAPEQEETPDEPAADEPTLDPAAMSALRGLMQTMQGDEA